MAEQARSGKTSGTGTGSRETGKGVGRVLVAVYAVFALSASARAGVQLVTRYHEAPLAYLLSAFAGGVYILATVGLAGRGRAFRTLAWVAVLVEMTGVLIVGTVSVAAPADFPEATVWSGYGAGYGWVRSCCRFSGSCGCAARAGTLQLIQRETNGLSTGRMSRWN